MSNRDFSLVLISLPGNNFKVMVSTLPKNMCSSLLDELPAESEVVSVWPVKVQQSTKSAVSLTHQTPHDVMLSVASTIPNTRIYNQMIRLGDTQFFLGIESIWRTSYRNHKVGLDLERFVDRLDYSDVVRWLKKGNYIPKLTGQI